MYNINGNNDQANGVAFSALQGPSLQNPGMQMPGTTNTQQTQQTKSPQQTLQDIVALTTLQNDPLINQQAIHQAMQAEEQQLSGELGSQGNGMQQDPIAQMMSAIQNGSGGMNTGMNNGMNTGMNGGTNSGGLNLLESLAAGGNGMQQPFQNQQPFQMQQPMQTQQPFGGTMSQQPFGATTSQQPFVGQQTFANQGLQQPGQNASTPFSGPGLNTNIVNAKAGNFSIVSEGDPHLASNVDGKKSHSDDMGSQSDLVDANASFQGGYQVSTQIGNADDKGHTYNKEVDVQAGDSKVAVTGTKGNLSATVTNANGQSQTLSQGQSITTAGGATVTMDKDGVQVSDNNNTGGSINTNITGNDHGLDTKTSGNDVALGGFAASQNQNGVSSGTGDATSSVDNLGS